MNITSATSLTWLDSGNTVFSADITIDDYGSEVFTHVCREDDPYTAFPDFWTEVVTDGTYGVISNYVEPTASALAPIYIGKLREDFNSYLESNPVTTTVSSIQMIATIDNIHELQYMWNAETTASSSDMDFHDAVFAVQSSVTLANVETIIEDMKAFYNTKYQLYLGYLDDISAAADKSALEALNFDFS